MNCLFMIFKVQVDVFLVRKHRKGVMLEAIQGWATERSLVLWKLITGNLERVTIERVNVENSIVFYF